MYVLFNSMQFQYSESEKESIFVRKEAKEVNWTVGSIITLIISSAIALASEIPSDFHCFDKRNCLSPVISSLIKTTNIYSFIRSKNEKALSQRES